MAEVKWIKLSTEIFDNRKIKQLECLPNGDSFIIIWIKLLCLAGQTNDCGLVYLTKEVAYTEQMLAQQFNRPLPIVQMALATFEQFGMIEIVDDLLMISNWEKYQNAEGLEKIREQTRKRVAKHREKQKVLPCNVTGNVTVTQCNATDIDKDIDIDIDSNIINNITLSPASGDEVKKSRINYQEIVDLYNDTCHSLPKVKALSDNRKRAIKKIIDKYGREKLEEVFELTERSDFLKGKTGSWRGATFDWIVKEQNFVKILEGNYESRGGARKGNYDDVLEMLGGK